MNDELLSVTQAASALRVSTNTMREWIHSGVVPGFRVGPRLLKVRRSDLDHLIQEVA